MDPEPRDEADGSLFDMCEELGISAYFFCNYCTTRVWNPPSFIWQKYSHPDDPYSRFFFCSDACLVAFNAKVEP